MDYEDRTKANGPVVIKKFPAKYKVYTEKHTPIRAVQLFQDVTVHTGIVGPLQAVKGDYIVEGKGDELIVVKKEIFEETYDEIAIGRR